MAKPPAAPDPIATSKAQAEMNKQTAITQQGLNMVDTYSPTGSVQYAQQGTWADGTPRYTQTSTYNPAQQAIFDSTTAAQGNLANLAKSQSSFLNDYLAKPFSFDNNDAANWAYDLGSQRLDPRFAEQETALRTTLANKGIREGSAAWNSEMGRLGESKNDAYNQLMLTGRGQAFNEALTGRNQPINEIIGLMSGSQLQNPGAGAPAAPQTGVAGTDYMGMVNQNYQNQVNATNQSNAAMGGLFGSVAGMFRPIKLSDSRLKTDVVRVGELPSGLPLYDYRYIGDESRAVHRGVMAQEVVQMFPGAVVYTPVGMAVNYAGIK